LAKIGFACFLIFWFLKSVMIGYKFVFLFWLKGWQQLGGRGLFFFVLGVDKSEFLASYNFFFVSNI
jgi:hypothetical protein